MLSDIINKLCTTFILTSKNMYNISTGIERMYNDIPNIMQYHHFLITKKK